MTDVDKTPLILALGRRDHLNDDERAVIQGLPSRLRSFPTGTEIIREGSRINESCLVLNGLVARTQHLRDGKRQITALHVAGDFVDLHSLLLKVMDHGVIAMGPCTVTFVPHTNLKQISETHPHLSRLLWLSTVVDGAIQRAWITCLGRRSADQHFAHLLCELYVRLDVVGLIRDHSFTLPVTQAEMGDILGMSNVHVNRTLQGLRASGSVVWEGRAVTITDFDKLAGIADFDPLYLNLHREPR